MNDTQKNYNILLDAIKINNISAEDLLNADLIKSIKDKVIGEMIFVIKIY